MPGIKIIQPYNEYADAYKQIATRADEAQAVLSEPGTLGSHLGKIVWHAVLDEVALLRKELAAIRSQRDIYCQQLTMTQQQLHAVEMLAEKDNQNVVVWPTTNVYDPNTYHSTSAATPYVKLTFNHNSTSTV
jgi:hypothetical protein